MPSSHDAFGSVSPPICERSAAVISFPSAMSSSPLRVFLGPVIQLRTLGLAGSVTSRMLQPRSVCAPAYMYQRPFTCWTSILNGRWPFKLVNPTYSTFCAYEPCGSGFAGGRVCAFNPMKPSAIHSHKPQRLRDTEKRFVLFLLCASVSLWPVIANQPFYLISRVVVGLA